MADHPFQVKVALSPEEYVAFKAVAEHIGTTQSGLLRMMAKEKIKSHAESMRAGPQTAMDEMGQE